MALEKANSHNYVSDDDRWSSCETHLVASTSTLFLDFVCRVCSYFNRWNTTKNLCYKFQQGFNSYYITPLNMRVLCAVCVSLSLCVYVCVHAPVCVSFCKSECLPRILVLRKRRCRKSKQRERQKKEGLREKREGWWRHRFHLLLIWKEGRKKGRKNKRKVGRYTEERKE